MSFKRGVVLSRRDNHNHNDLVLFAQFEKREKHPWGYTFKSKNPPWVFFTFLKFHQIAQRITLIIDCTIWGNYLRYTIFPKTKKNLFTISYYLLGKYAMRHLLKRNRKHLLLPCLHKGIFMSKI